MLAYYFCTVQLDSTLHCSILLCFLLYFALRIQNSEATRINFRFLLWFDIRTIFMRFIIRTRLRNKTIHRQCTLRILRLSLIVRNRPFNDVLGISSTHIWTARQRRQPWWREKKDWFILKLAIRKQDIFCVKKNSLFLWKYSMYMDHENDEFLCDALYMKYIYIIC